jgi:hypothetical protein
VDRRYWLGPHDRHPPLGALKLSWRYVEAFEAEAAQLVEVKDSSR